MAFKLRFIQRFRAENEEAFMDMEKQFAVWEKNNPALPDGKRYRPYIGREPTNTLIWECELPTLEKVTEVVQLIESSAEHDALLDKAKDVAFYEDGYVEIYKSVDF
jgi:hypothetical protein